MALELRDNRRRAGEQLAAEAGHALGAQGQRGIAHRFTLGVGEQAHLAALGVHDAFEEFCAHRAAPSCRVTLG